MRDDVPFSPQCPIPLFLPLVNRFRENSFRERKTPKRSSHTNRHLSRRGRMYMCLHVILFLLFTHLLFYLLSEICLSLSVCTSASVWASSAMRQSSEGKQIFIEWESTLLLFTETPLWAFCVYGCVYETIVRNANWAAAECVLVPSIPLSRRTLCAALKK